MATALFFCHHSFPTFYKVVYQPDDVHASTFPQICNHSWTWRTSILEGANFHRMNWWQVPLMKSLQGHRNILPLGPFPLGLRFLDAFLSSSCVKEFGDGFDCLILARFFYTVTETTIVSFRTLSVGFPIANESRKNSLYTLFCPSDS